ncbi:MAG: hypothetical protein J7M30_10765, partial [Deltaproteobacteria bacterium]|nr:hypothetical protein [Deltaproteobacteria bacterium]
IYSQQFIGISIKRYDICQKKKFTSDICFGPAPGRPSENSPKMSFGACGLTPRENVFSDSLIDSNMILWILEKKSPGLTGGALLYLLSLFI